MPKLPRPHPRLAALATTAAAATLLLLALASGCTSDTSNPLGAGLAETVIDTVLAPLAIDQVTDFGVLAVSDPRVPLDQTEVLYIGSTGTEQSSILVNYDFSVLDHPDSAYLLPFLAEDNIASAEIRLYMLTWYTPWRGGASPGDEDFVEPVVKLWPGSAKYYDVHELDAPFDTLSYPGPEPSYTSATINEIGNEPQKDGPVVIGCVVEPIAAWLAARREVGVIIREGSGSEPGLLGFASKEMVHGGSTLPQLNAGVTLGAALRLRLINTPDSWVSDRQYAIFGPSADVPTWHQLQQPYTNPAEGVMVRTHLRSYPLIRFALGALPPNVRINRANLVVVNDTLRSEGHRTVLTCSEIRPDFAPPGETTVLLRDLEPEINFMAGNGTWEPEHKTDHELTFNVTASIQRFVNGAYEGERGFVIAAGEYFFPGFNSNPDPDFWFTKWIFFGVDAEPDLRPRLEISYTRLDELDPPEVTP